MPENTSTTPVTQPAAVTASEVSEDKVTKTQTIYEVSAGQIFWRNFIAGMSRALGGMFIYLLFLFLGSVVFAQIILPQLNPLISEYRQALQSINSINQMKPAPGIEINQEDLQSILDQFRGR